MVTTGAATPSKSYMYTPLTVDNLFLFFNGPSATACNGFMKPTESLPSVLFQGTPSSFVSLVLVPISSLLERTLHNLQFSDILLSLVGYCAICGDENHLPP